MPIQSNNKELVKTIKRNIKSGLCEKVDQIVEQKAIISILSKRDCFLLIKYMNIYETYSVNLVVVFDHTLLLS